MGKLVVRIVGGVVASYLGAGIVVGAMALLGIYQQLWAGYVPLMLAATVIGAVTTGVLLLYAHVLGGVPVQAFSFAADRRDVVVGGLSAALLLGLAAGYIVLLDRLGLRTVTPVAPSWGVIAIGLLGAAGTIHEEVLWRGYALPLLRRYGIGRALVIGAVLFMLMHFATRGVSFLAVTWFLWGLGYGYVYLRSGSLLVAGVVHALHNFAADLFLYSDNGVALVAFATKLGAVEKVSFEIVQVAVIGLLMYVAYGRGRLLDVSPRLQARWDLIDDVPAVVPQPLPVSIP
ncbi:MAG: CPBP family intramembrane metalloprotease [Chloroflexota bacterium]|nr:CPBP family intramembrane metalloprotease [Chloroflexota bacterium]